MKPFVPKRLGSLRGKKLTVAFLVSHSSIWKFGNLASKLGQNQNVQVLVVGSEYGHQNRKTGTTQERALARLSRAINAKFYWVPTTANHALGLQKLKASNLVVTSQPYAWLNQSINNIIDNKTVAYLPYSYTVTNSPLHVTPKTIRRAAIVFCESEWHKQYLVQQSPQMLESLVVTGYPTVWSLLQQPNTDHGAIVILWAPHWTTARSSEGRESLRAVADCMVEVSKREMVRVVIRPHPLLPTYLEEEDKQLFAYIFHHLLCQKNVSSDSTSSLDSLFQRSSIMIHNSGSFIAEYAATGKPVIFVRHEGDYIFPNLNKIGVDLLSGSYTRFDALGIMETLNVILDGANDFLAEQRDAIRQSLKEQNANDPSAQMAKHILYLLENRK